MGKRSGWTVAGELLAALAIGAGVMGVLFLGFAVLFIWGHAQPGGGETDDPPSPLRFTVQLADAPGGDPPAAVDLHLDPADVEALDLPSPIVAGAYGRVTVVSPLTDADQAARYHCLAGAADVVDPDTGATVVTIPAGMCLGRGDLIVPTPAAPAFDAELETFDPYRPDPAETLTGQLVVRYDGCATIGGRRVLWRDRHARVDADGSVILREGTLANGSTVSVRTSLPGSVPPACPGGPPLLVEGIA